MCTLEASKPEADGYVEACVVGQGADASGVFEREGERRVVVDVVGGEIEENALKLAKQ